MKATFLSSAAILLLSTALSIASGVDWMTDYEKALDKAKAENKMVLLDFTGSDWCGWCIKLNNEVFSQKEFQDYASDNLILVELDFPRNKRIPRRTQRQNNELQAKYGIRGFPTIIVLNSEGEKVGQLGYIRGGPEAFVAELRKLDSKS